MTIRQSSRKPVKVWEHHQVDVCENLVASKVDDDVKISVPEAPHQLRDNLLVNSQQFESNYNKLRALIQAYRNSNKSWIANDFRTDTKESDPMGKTRQTREIVQRVRKERALRTRMLVNNPPRQHNKRSGRCKSGCRRSSLCSRLRTSSTMLD